ncbi:hypothetical protein [uncultured Clostridium sp.]|uniref:hypothetical protein n=1 Tax=uncultured Clostridium sp. TaxID=59620 RepID=UPI0026F045E8|nr:hypothetical protein [uncultured Clostridium sp.]
MEKVYIVCSDNGEVYDDYDWFIVKVFKSEKEAENFKENYTPETNEFQDHKPRVWIDIFNVE